MEIVPYPDGSNQCIEDSLEKLKNIKNRAYPVEFIHKILEDMYKDLKDLVNFREEYLKEEKLSVINLSTVVHSTVVNEDGSIYIKINDVIISIFPHKDVIIVDGYDAYKYSINKVDNTQKLYYSHFSDAKLHQLVKEYKEVKSMYIYKVGNRIELTTFKGSYVITKIDDKYANITCKKWKAEGKVDKTIRVKDIKGLASNNFNSIWK